MRLQKECSVELKRRLEPKHDIFDGSVSTCKTGMIIDTIARRKNLDSVISLCNMWNRATAGVYSEYAEDVPLHKVKFVRREILDIFGLKMLVSLLSNPQRSRVLIPFARQERTSSASWILFPNWWERHEMHDGEYHE